MKGNRALWHYWIATKAQDNGVAGLWKGLPWPTALHFAKTVDGRRMKDQLLSFRRKHKLWKAKVDKKILNSSCVHCFAEPIQLLGVIVGVTSFPSMPEEKGSRAYPQMLKRHCHIWHNYVLKAKVEMILIETDSRSWKTKHRAVDKLLESRKC